MHTYFFFKQATCYFFSFLICISSSLLAQNEPFYYLMPIKQDVSLSGTFGELRANHLHSGIDIRTNGEEGWPVFAVDSGFVSRINISPFGFGKTIYIDHPRGIVSVYAHLKEFNQIIESFVKSEQYKQKTADGNFFPKNNQIKINKGEYIALSGNSGSSGGPHLHFEFRDSLSQKPLNPEAYFTIRDHIKPEIQALVIYPIDRFSSVNGKNSKLFVPINKDLKSLKNIKLSGKIGFGVQVTDYHDRDNNSNGIYSIHVQTDSLQIFQLKLDSFSFDQTRYANSVCDYEYMMAKKIKIYKCFVEPGNKLPAYETSGERGIINFQQMTNTTISITAFDYAGNSDNIKIIPQIDTFPLKNYTPNTGIEVDFKTKKTIDFGKVKLDFNTETFFDTVWVSLNETKASESAASPFYEILPAFTPVFKKFTISVSCPEIQTELQKKLVLCWFNGDNKPQSRGGEYNNEWIIAQVNQFGKYALMLDTLAPQIKALNFSKGEDLTAKKSIRIKLSDNLSGISKYEGFINNNWVVFDWDQKNEMVEYFFDEKCGPGPNFNLLFNASDNCGNSTLFESNYVRK